MVEKQWNVINMNQAVSVIEQVNNTVLGTKNLKN